MTKGKIDVFQGVAALVGITLGVIPLAQLVLAGRTGSLWGVLPGGDGPVGPIVVVLLTVLVVAVLEARKRR